MERVCGWVEERMGEGRTAMFRGVFYYLQAGSKKLMNGPQICIESSLKINFTYGSC